MSSSPRFLVHREIKEAAYDLLKMSPEEIERCRVDDLRRMLRRAGWRSKEEEAKHDHDQERNPPKEEKPNMSMERIQAYIRRKRERKPPNPKADNTTIITESEIDQLRNIFEERRQERPKLVAEERRSAPTKPVPRPKMMKPASTAMGLPPLDVQRLCRSVTGMQEIHKHAQDIQTHSNVLESAVRQKAKILLEAKQCMDEEDLEYIQRSMHDDFEQLATIRKWLNHVANQLSTVIARRKQLYADLQKCPQNGSMQVQTLEKIHMKNTKMEMLHNVIRSRCQMLPSAPVVLNPSTVQHEPNE